MITAILIDDSTSSIEALQLKLEKHCPDIEVVQTCTDPEKAIAAIGTYKPDVIFLDVEMPVMNGFTLLRQVAVIDFEIIFVTAYNHYAIPAIRVNALDYLEKPVSIKQLEEAVERLRVKLKSSLSRKKTGDAAIEKLLETIQQLPGKQASLALPSSEGIQMIDIGDIVWLESVNNYTRFHLKSNQRILISKTMGDYEDRLKDYGFLRIHRSYIINMSYLYKYHRNDGGFVEMKTGERLEIAVRKKQDLLDKLKEME
jgi:two-component system, LytTR family, response regulator